MVRQYPAERDTVGKHFHVLLQLIYIFFMELNFLLIKEK
jgi:hypothetical protein